MIITSAQITSYHLPVTIYRYAKQTQTKPIYAEGLSLKLHLFLIDSIYALSRKGCFTAYRDIERAYFIGRKPVLLASVEPKAKPGSNVEVMEMI
jgi:hypothetical protein